MLNYQQKVETAVKLKTVPIHSICAFFDTPYIKFILLHWNHDFIVVLFLTGHKKGFTDNILKECLVTIIKENATITIE